MANQKLAKTQKRWGKKAALEPSDVADDVLAESLKSPDCIEILCLRNVETDKQRIFTH